MKEVELPVAKIEVQAEKQELKTPQLVGRIRPHKGHRLFELDLNNGAIRYAEFMEETVQFSPRKEERGIQKRVLTKEGHIYTSALNLKNADKNFKKMLFGKR